MDDMLICVLCPYIDFWICVELLLKIFPVIIVHMYSLSNIIPWICVVAAKNISNNGIWL
jgi:hypothetical protein